MQPTYQIVGLVDALEKQAGQKEQPGVWDQITNWIYKNPEWASSIAGGLVGGGVGAATGRPGTGLSRFLIGALLGGGAGYGAGYLGRNKIQSWLDPERYTNARKIESDEKTWLTDAIAKGEVDPKNPEVIRLAKHHGIDISKITPGDSQRKPAPNTQQPTPDPQTQQPTTNPQTQEPGWRRTGDVGTSRAKEIVQQEAQNAMRSTNQNSNRPIVPPAGVNTPANFRTSPITLPGMDLTPSWQNPYANDLTNYGEPHLIQSRSIVPPSGVNTPANNPTNFRTSPNTMSDADFVTGMVL